MRLKILIAFLIIFTTSGAAATQDNVTEPDNVTLELEFDAQNTYVVDGNIETDSSFSTQTANYPYIVSERPAGIVSYSNTLNISYQNISATRDRFSITQSAGSFLLPFTTGGYEAIENREDQVQNRNFLNLLNPSFNFPIPQNQLVKVSYSFPYNISSFDGRQTDIDEITVRNKINSKKGIELDVSTN